ncbi:MAG: GDP-L-fucose synthase [Polyangiaceae bacterium]
MASTDGRIYRIEPGTRTFVAGHRGLVGAALTRALRARGCTALIERDRSALDLRDAAAVHAFFAETRPELVFVAAAKVGGIVANAREPVAFLAENLHVQLNLLEAAHAHDVARVVFFGSSCIYPRLSEQPIREDALLGGPLEPTNQWYAVAKIAGLKLVEAHRAQFGRKWISLMPTNLYGPGDNFDATGSHVIPGLLRRFHEAKQAGADEVVVWGSGTPRREFMFVDDLARASLALTERYDGDGIVNVGTGVDVSIAELASVVAEVVGFRGRIVFDPSKPDGTPRKLLDVGLLRELDPTPPIALAEGLRKTYAWFTSSGERVRT